MALFFIWRKLEIIFTPDYFSIGYCFNHYRLLQETIE